MKIPVNLSSEPFRRDRPMVVGTVAVSLMLVILLGIFTSLAIGERNRARETRQAIAKITQQLRTMSNEQNQLEAVLRKPEDAEVLDRSVFVNTLIQRKGISWTRIFSDLEKVMPHDVRLVSVRPQLNGPNDLFLEMDLGAPSPDSVVNFLMQLESSPLFGSTTIRSSRPPSQTDPLYRYTVSVSYAQKL
jgi:hypothetical protein